MKYFTTRSLIKNYIDLNCTRESGIYVVIMCAKLQHVNRDDVDKILDEMVLEKKIVFSGGKFFKR